MDPLSQQETETPKNQNRSNSNSNPFKKLVASPASPSWPSSPLVKPHAVGASATQSPIVWPARPNPPTPTQYQHHPIREPRSPIREPRSPIREPRRPTHELPPPSHSHSHSLHHHHHHHHPVIHRPDKPLTKIRVTGIERNRRDSYIKFDAWSNLTTTRAGHCPNVSRSYKEFLAFHEALVSNNPHTIVPPIPFPNTSAPSPADDDRLVASAFQQFFDRLLLNQFLRTDDELRIFLESDFGYTPQTKTKKRSITSGSGWLSKPAVGSSVRTLPSSSIQQHQGASPDTVVSIVEEDELSNAKLQFRLLEDRLVDCCRSVEQLSRSRRTLSQALVDLSGRVVQFSTTESHGALAEGLRRLGQTIRAISELESNSAVGYLVTLSDGLSWCSISAKAAKDVLRNRAGVLHEHYTSVKKSIEKRRLIERIKSNTISVSSERVETALDELEEAKKVEEVIAHKAQLISNNLRPSLRTHSELLHDDLLYSLMENARTQLIYEKQILKELERVKPELDAISLRPANVIYGHPSNTTTTAGSGKGFPDAGRQAAYAQSGDSQTATIGRRESGQYLSHQPLAPSSSVPSDPSSAIINHHHIRPTPVRTAEVSKTLRVHDRLGQNVDCRQRVDAKSAAASLARLF
ncbi:hypothetical protein PCASD_07526 [Puccinia coronata f. sp. avenae]|uniref:PX domain-containing protein n=1 Tax=Puccinia coronata f. sp. avenae TaxID=200324 RepID=A0A2N5V0A7_9BASI|nr:hypothetical protein PCASD_07526 [Puccinia coronata f. sp. avenae]